MSDSFRSVSMITHDKIVEAMVLYRQQEDAKAKADPMYRACGCLGPKNGDPFCPCAMRRMHEQADFILTNCGLR